MVATKATGEDADVDEPDAEDSRDETDAETPGAEAEETDAAATDEDDAGAPEDAKGGEDAEDAEDEEPFKRQRDKARHRKRPWRQYLRRSILPALLVAALAVSGFLGWKQWQEHQIKQAGEQAQQAAINYAQVLTSIDSNNVDQNFRQVLDGATGEFKDMYTQSSVQLRQLLIDNKATAHGVVVDSAIQSESTNKVVVLVFIDQTVTNTQAPDPRIDRSRIKMTMEKVDGRWRASKVQLL